MPVPATIVIVNGQYIKIWSCVLQALTYKQGPLARTPRSIQGSKKIFFKWLYHGNNPSSTHSISHQSIMRTYHVYHSWGKGELNQEQRSLIGWCRKMIRYYTAKRNCVAICLIREWSQFIHPGTGIPPLRSTKCHWQSPWPREWQILTCTVIAWNIFKEFVERRTCASSCLPLTLCFLYISQCPFRLLILPQLIILN